MDELVQLENVLTQKKIQDNALRVQLQEVLRSCEQLIVEVAARSRRGRGAEERVYDKYAETSDEVSAIKSFLLENASQSVFSMMGMHPTAAQIRSEIESVEASHDALREGISNATRYLRRLRQIEAATRARR